MHFKSIHSIWNAELSASLDEKINNKTKPLGSLGILEDLGRQIGLIQRTTEPRIASPHIIVFAGDHGIVEEGISAYPQSVTWQMVENFLAGGAAINVFSKQNRCGLQIVDAGVNHDFGVRDGLIDRKVGFGTRNFLREPGMTSEQCALAMRHGAALVNGLDCDVVGFGDMGIGNTTAAAAIMHKITGVPIAECVGAGAGMPSNGIEHKQRIIARAVAFHASVNSPLDVLSTFGGFEIAMTVGAMVAAAERRAVILVDGFIVTSALLIATFIQPAVLDYCVFSHCSDEHGHKRMLDFLSARALLQLDLRLGEGTGGALALPLLHAAVNFMNEMATFESAAVSGTVPQN